MLYLINPQGAASAGTGRKRTAKRKKRKPSAKQIKARKAFARLSRAKAKARRLAASSKTRRKGAAVMAAKKRTKRRRKAVVRRAAASGRKRRTRRVRRSPAVRVQRRGRTVYASNPRKRRRYRRNPGLSGRGILSMVTGAGKDALAVIGGLAGTNFIARKVPFGEGNKAIEAAKKAAVAVVLGMVAGKALGRNVGEKVLVGGMVAVGIDLLRNVPQVGTALAGDDDLRYIARTGLSAYALPAAPMSAGMSAWPAPGVGGGDAAAYRH